MFKPTEWETAEEKERFSKQFKRFVLGGFQQKDFPKWFYTRLSMTFGNIAHYSREGFYGYWFRDVHMRREFVQWCLRWPCYGDPTYTYSDVEQHLQKWIMEESGLYQMELI